MIGAYLNLKNIKIAVIGLGYVGLPLAVEFGKMRQVIGFDINLARISELKSQLDKTLELSSEKIKEAIYLRFTSDVRDLADAGIYIVTVPTPIDKVNRPNFSPLVKASELVGSILKKGNIVIYESTVYPGATEEICVPILESISGLKFNEGFYCGYSPERINPGDKLNTLSTIIKVTSGSTPEVALAVDNLYQEIITAGTYRAKSIKVAEAAKVIENSQRDLNIAFMNELAMVFNKLDIDTMDVLNAASTKWNFLPFRPGLVGGHCISVDPYYLTHKLEELGYKSKVILTGRKINDEMPEYIAVQLIKMMIKNGVKIFGSKVGVLGVTFKENCPDIRNSKVFNLVDKLREWDIEVDAFDPIASPKAVLENYGLSIKNTLPYGKYDALIIAVSHSEYQGLNIQYMKSLFVEGSPVILADLKSMYDPEQLKIEGIKLFRL